MLFELISLTKASRLELLSHKTRLTYRTKSDVQSSKLQQTRTFDVLMNDVIDCSFFRGSTINKYLGQAFPSHFLQTI